MSNSSSPQPYNKVRVIPGFLGPGGKSNQAFTDAIQYPYESSFGSIDYQSSFDHKHPNTLYHEDLYDDLGSDLEDIGVIVDTIEDFSVIIFY